MFPRQILFVLLIIKITSSFNFRKEGELKESFGKLNLLVRNLRQILKFLLEYKRDKYLKKNRLPLDEVNIRVPENLRIVPKLKRTVLQCSECDMNATAFLGLWKHMKVAHRIDISNKWLKLDREGPLDISDMDFHDRYKSQFKGFTNAKIE